MNIVLVRAGVNDAEKLWEMQQQAFLPLLEKYQDTDSNPASEPIERMVHRLRLDSTYFYFINVDGKTVGGIRVIDDRDSDEKIISPIFILPQYQGKGYGSIAMAETESLHGNHGWKLYVGSMETQCIYFFERLGYVKTEEERAVNRKLTLVQYEKK